EIRLTALTANDVLTLRVTNTIAENKAPGEDGIGIKNVRERLAVQFDGRATLTTGPRGSQWISEITMPVILDSPERRSIRRAAPLVGV
ncbi:MAG: Histidine kinase, partial [Gammaproteobacteria bacterium]|nr:Histidine kinase [Gammaproteobacteria bacterium]